MGANVHKTSQAETDIANAIMYLLQQNPQAAQKFVLDFRCLTERLSRFPELYPLQRRSTAPEWQKVRMAVLIRFGYLVFYTFEQDTVIFRRVIHGSRDEP